MGQLYTGCYVRYYESKYGRTLVDVTESVVCQVYGILVHVVRGKLMAVRMFSVYWAQCLAGRTYVSRLVIEHGSSLLVNVIL